MNLRVHADSADVEAVEAVGRLPRDGLICGVRTNPTILGEANRGLAEISELSRKWHEEAAEEGFFQAVGTNIDLITAVYSLAQATIAGSLGVTYVAPYLARLDRPKGDGHETVARVHRPLTGSDTRVLVAGVLEPADVETLVGNGITDITYRPEVIDDSLIHPESATVAAQFLADAGLAS